MTAKSIMFMGTGSDVGKSLIVAGLARLLSNRGVKVAPFKPQNMSNNAAVTSDGGEIGRAQALQARASRMSAIVHMNPVLLKPESTTGAQVIVQGRRAATMTARDYFQNRQIFMPAILDSFERLRNSCDIVLVEGAGSPAEMNLRDGDLANMGFARAANVPAILIGDVHRGGVIASIVGTFALLSPADRALLKAFIINRFHGDPSLFHEGQKLIERETGTPCLGVLPHFAEAHKLPAEDAMALESISSNYKNKTVISVLKLPRIANFDDLDPLRMEPNVSVEFVQGGQPIPAEARLVIIPGSTSTMTDLAALKNSGWDIDIKAHVRRGGYVLGLCGGYQMLGRTIHDPDGIEGQRGSVEGLNLLNVETVLLADKTTVETTGIHVASGTLIKGYEIHLGKSHGADCVRPFCRTERGPEGAISPNGRIAGTYLHGCFSSDAFRKAFLASIGTVAGDVAYESEVDATLDQLAVHLEKHVDVDAVLDHAG